LVSKLNLVQRAILWFLILKLQNILEQTQGILVDTMLEYFCAKGNNFKSGSLILGILLLKQYTFSVSDFCKIIYKSEKCQTSGIRSHLVLAIQGYSWLWLIVLWSW
jgi:hypothetical protein